MKEKIQKSMIRRGLRTSVLMLFFSIFTFVFLPYLLADVNALDASTLITWTPVSLTLEDGGDVAFGEVTPASGGSMKIVRKNIAVTSNGHAVNVYLSTGSTTSNGLDISYGSTTSSLSIGPVGGTWASPADFPATGSKWGFAIEEKTVNSAVVYDTNFSTPTTYSSLPTTTQINPGETGHKAGKWLSVPLKNAAQLIWSAETSGTTFPQGFGTGTGQDPDRGNFNIYYAVTADTDLVAGIYQNTVIYTAIANDTQLDEVSDNILVSNLDSNTKISTNRKFAAGGDRFQVNFDLAQSQAGLVEGKVTKAYLVPHNMAVAANGDVNAKVFDGNTKSLMDKASGFKECAIDTSSYTVNTTGTASAQFECQVASDVAIVPSSGTDTTTGYYDLWVNISEYNLNYISKISGGSEPTLVFAGLQSKSGTGANNYVVTKMQEMTSSVCKNTNMWGAEVGDSAKLYDNSGTGTAIATGTAGLAEGMGTFELTDTRDKKTYLVRRLADGNCWMVQNLDLELGEIAAGTMRGSDNTVTTLTDANTDLNSKTSYTLPTYTAGQLQDRIGAAQALVNNVVGSNTYQPKTAYGTGYRWGSLLNESGATLAADCSNKSQLPDGSTNGTATVNGDVCVENNSRSAIPRSYDNGSDWIQNDGGYNISTVNSGKGADGASAKHQSSGTPTSTVGDNPETQYIGNWYNWYAATAESGTWEMKTDSVAGSAEDSICPAGWQLPVNANGSTDGVKNKSWYNLLTDTYYPTYKTAIKNLNTELCTNAGYTVRDNRCKDGDTNKTNITEYIDSITSTGGSRMLRSFPLSIIFSGYYDWVNGGQGRRGADGSYWSSTPYAYTYSRYLYFFSTCVRPQNGYNKAYGFTVRCVAR